MNKIIIRIKNWYKFFSEGKKYEIEFSEPKNSGIRLATKNNEAHLSNSNRPSIPENYLKIKNQDNATSLINYVQGSLNKSILTNNNFKNLYKGNSRGSLMIYKDGSYSSINVDKKGKIIGKAGFTPATIAKLKALTLVLASEVTGHAHMYKIKAQLNEISDKLNVLLEKSNNKSKSTITIAHSRIEALDNKKNYLPTDLNELRTHINTLQELKIESDLNFKSAYTRLHNSKELEINRSKKKIVRFFQEVKDNVENTGAKVLDIGKELDNSDIFLYAIIAIKSEQLQQVGELLELKILEHLTKKDYSLLDRFEEDFERKLKEGFNDTVADGIKQSLRELDVKIKQKKQIFSKVIKKKATTRKILDFNNHFDEQLKETINISRDGIFIKKRLEELERISNQDFEFIIDNTKNREDVYINMIKE